MSMDITIHASFLPHDDPEASLAFYRDALGFEVRINELRLVDPLPLRPDPPPWAGGVRVTQNENAILSSEDVDCDVHTQATRHIGSL